MWGQQVRSRRGRNIKNPVYAKRGRYEPDDESQFGSAAPSEYGDDDLGMFAVLTGRAPRAAKKAAPLSALGVATGSVASRDDDDRCRSRSSSRSGFEEEQDQMEVDEPSGSFILPAFESVTTRCQPALID